MHTTDWMTQSDGQAVFIRKWHDQTKEPHAVIQIAHGMAEHSERYHDFARTLSNHGYIVYANDHRGHGQTGKQNDLMGHFSEKNGFERAVDDLYAINQQIKTDHPELPLVLLGHSMGSFLVRRFIQRYQTDIDAVILSGTSFSKGIVGKIGRLIAKIEIRRLGAKSESKLMDQLSFGQYNKGLPESESWLSRDAEAVAAYHNDPLCGFISTAKFYDDLLYGIEKIHQRTEIAKVKKNLPLYIMSGAADPVGDYGKGIHRVVKQYKQHGIQLIELKLYPEARHELLFETNRNQVVSDLLSWLNTVSQ